MIPLLSLGFVATVTYLYRRDKRHQEHDRTHVSAQWLKELSEGRKAGVIAQPEPGWYAEERRVSTDLGFFCSHGWRGGCPKEGKVKQ